MDGSDQSEGAGRYQVTPRLAEREVQPWTNSAGWLADHASGKAGLGEADAEGYLANAVAYVDTMFSGSRAALRPLYDRLYDLARSIGSDVRICPGKTAIAMSRTHVIAQIKAATRTRVDFGLALKDTPAKGRLIDTGGLAKKDRITHRIEITKPEDIDAYVEKWCGGRTSLMGIDNGQWTIDKEPPRSPRLHVTVLDAAVFNRRWKTAAASPS